MRGAVFGLNLVRFCGFWRKYSLRFAGRGFWGKFRAKFSAVFGKIIGGFAVFSEIFSGFAVFLPLLYPPRVTNLASKVTNIAFKAKIITVDHQYLLFDTKTP